jgi:hypothetical protein
VLNCPLSLKAWVGPFSLRSIMMCFLEDEAENDDNHLFTFASGPLKKFMSGTKSIADAQAAYAESVRDAKTAKIRSDIESEKAILEGADGVRTNAKGGRGKDRKSKGKDKKNVKKAKKKGKKGGKGGEKDSGGGGDEGDFV